MRSLDEIAVFVQVAESRSFTMAAKRLGMSASGASRSVARLEARLGVRLVNRTTRNVNLTTDGTRYFERCRQVLGELDDAETELLYKQSRPSGRLRVQMPVGLGCKVVVPVLAEFAKLHREVIVDVEFSSRIADLAEEGLDAVIRTGRIEDSRLVARKICGIEYVAVASPAYLARYGEPRTPEELQGHCCFGYFIPQVNRYREWEFGCASNQLSPAISGNLNMNNGEALLHAALSDGGIAMVATYLAADAVRAGRLRVVLPEYVPQGPTVWLAYLHRQHMPWRMRAFVDYLSSEVPRYLTAKLI